MLLFLLAAYLYLHGSFDVKETDPKVDWRGIVGYDPTPKGSAYTVEHPNATTLDRVRAFGYHPDKAWTAKSILYATVLLCLALVLLIGFGVYLLMYYTEHIRFMRKELAA